MSVLVDVVVSVGLGALILAAGAFGIRMLRNAPPDPDPDRAVEVAMDYRCAVCGMRVTVTRAQGQEFTPPRHCHEEMEEAI